MSEQSGGAGWWRASDGLWYRPEQHPNYRPPQFAPPPPPPPLVASGRTAGDRIVLAGSAGIFVGAFLPWATVGPFTVAGTSGDGMITLVLAALIGWLTWVRRTRGLALALLIVTGLVAGYDLANIGRVAAHDSLFSVQIGGGLVLTVLSVAAGIGGWVSNHSAASTP